MFPMVPVTVSHVEWDVLCTFITVSELPVKNLYFYIMQGDVNRRLGLFPYSRESESKSRD